MAKRSANVRTGADRVGPSAAGFSAFEIVAISLCLARFLIPTEAAERGAGLWIAAGWFLLWTVCSWWRSRMGMTFVVRWTLVDLAVLVLIAGHLISGIQILTGTGQKRAALNLMWEWAGAGVFYCFIRTWTERHQTRRLVLNGILALGILLSGLGIWQHIVWYPRQAQRITELLDLQRRRDTGSLTPTDERLYQARVAQVGAEFLTLDEQGQQVYLNRVRESVEPIGFFALANTLGGFLTGGLLLYTGAIGVRWKNFSRWHRVLAGAGYLLVLSCLILTKSRTAFVGAALGMGLLGIALMRRQSSTWLRFARAGSLIMLGLCGLLALTWGFGGIDRQVVSEAPKSLQYRLEYWQATLNMLWESPVWGTGLGNFRQHYLKYKLPGSSEEILDPHQLFLDVWANGGLLALMGLIALVLLFLRTYGKLLQVNDAVSREQDAMDNADESAAFSRWPLVATGTLAICLVLGAEYFLRATFDEMTVWFLFGWIALTIATAGMFREFRHRALAATCATGAVFLHLCGAGGIGMPAILQFLLLLITCSVAEFPLRPIGTIRVSGIASLGVGVCALLGLLGIVWTAVLPVANTENLLALGNYELTIGGQVRSAERIFLEAAEQDSLSPRPWQALARVSYFNWQRGGAKDDTLFEEALDRQQQAIQRDPHSASGYRSLGELWSARFRADGESASAQAGASAFAQAATFYPHHAQIQAQLAHLLNAAGEDPSQAISRAIELDDLNRQAGHNDKILDKATRGELERLREVRTE